MDLKECRKLAAHLLGNAALREGQWRELSRWIGGNRGVFDDTRPDNFANDDIALFRTVPAQALLKGASGMTGGMTPRNASWFRPTFESREIEEMDGARQWLSMLDSRMKDCLASGGFYQAIQQFNTDLLWSGCALLFCERGMTGPLRFECAQIGSFRIGLNIDGLPDAVLRRLRMTPRRMAQYFGEDALSEHTKKLLEKEPYAERTVWHLARANSGKGAPNRGFTVDSLYWEEDGKDFLKKSGYYEMPFFYAVWNEGPTVYGTGPGDESLSDARQIDRMERDKLAGLGKLVDPPVAIPYTMKDAVDLSPGAINYVTSGENISPILDLSPYAAGMRALQEEIAIVSRRIEQSLMATIFASMPLDQRPANMSATEFLERKREALQQMGPVISAYEPNVLTPLLYRVAQTLDRENMLAPLPDSMQNIDVIMKIEFISPMANALRQTEAEAARALVMDVANIAQATQNINVFDKIDFDQTVDELAGGIGAPASILRSDDAVAEIRQERDAAMREREKAENAERMISMAEKAGNIARAGEKGAQPTADAGITGAEALANGF